MVLQRDLRKASVDDALHKLYNLRHEFRDACNDVGRLNLQGRHILVKRVLPEAADIGEDGVVRDF